MSVLTKYVDLQGQCLCSGDCRVYKGEGGREGE